MATDVSQVRLFAADLVSESGKVPQKASLALRATAVRIEGDARILAPVDTGALRNSITTSYRGGAGSTFMSAEIGPTVNYGIYQELGTSKMRAQPYLYPAADRHEPAFYSAMAQVVDP